MGDPVIHLSDEEDELDRTTAVRAPGFIFSLVDNSTEEEEEMTLNKGKSLRAFLEDRNKGQTSKDTTPIQPLPTPPPSKKLTSHTQLEEERKGER